MHTLGPFEIIEPIGEGGMGTVWRAEHRKQRVPVAVKFVLPKGGASEKLLLRFADEVRAVAGLSHPGIVSVFDYGTVPKALEESTGGAVLANTPWLAMELITGGNIKSIAPRNWAELHHRLGEILRALGSAHARGILHRDLKPDNILISGKGDLRSGLRLVDFGLAFLQADVHSNEQRAAGTPRYMAPEQLLSNWRDFGPWTDLYALGCLAWQLSTGATPFHTCKQFRQLVRAHLHLAPPPFQPLFRVPDSFEGWLRTLLAKRRSDRFRFAADALAALPPVEVAASLEITRETAAISDDVPDLDATIQTLPSTATIEIGTEDSIIDDSTAVTLPKVGGFARLRSQPLPSATSLDGTIPEMPDSWFAGNQERSRLQLLGVGLGLFGLRSTNLVGRERERTQLWNTLRTVRRNQKPQILILSGGPGCGKSRLADWLVHRAHELGAAVPLRCVHDPQTGSASGLSAMVQHHLNTAGLERDDLEDRVAKLLDRQGVADAYEMRALCDFIDNDQDSSLSDFSVSMQFQSPPERMALMVRFLARSAARRPVILWMDDVQWGDEALMLARTLQDLPAEQKCPVLVVMTLRQDLLEDRPLERMLLSELDKRSLQHLRIKPLGNKEQVALVEDMLGLEAKLARKVVARSQGTPLFAVQLVGDWVQRGVLEVGQAGFRLRDGASAAIPSSIHQMWMERIDALLSELPEGSERALEIAAVLGMEVDRSEWGQVCSIEGMALNSELVEGLLRRRLALSAESPGRLRHAHGMLRESLVRRAREAGRLEHHHLGCAAMLKESASLRGLAERRARHLIAGRAHEEALIPLLLAASERKASGDLRQVLALLDVHQKAAIRAGLEASNKDRLRAQVLRSEIEGIMGNSEESTRLADAALEHARKIESPFLIGAALRVLGIHTQRAGHTHGAWEMFEEALLHLINAEASELLVLTHLHLANLSRFVGWWKRGREHAQEALKRAEALAVPVFIGNSHFYCGLLREQQRDFKGASEHFATAARHHEDAGNRLGAANCINALGNQARLAGNFHQAERAFRQAIALHQSIGSAQDLGPMMSLALAHLDMGDFGAAREILESGVARCRKRELNNMLGCALACLLPCYASAQEWQAWDAALNEARSLLEETGVLSLDVANPVETGALMALRAKQPKRAKQAYEIALRQWMGLGRDDKVGEVMKAMDELHLD
jgi:serine/threonine protein kinase/tetratricopeptide (TPR) repeat protein